MADPNGTPKGVHVVLRTRPIVHWDKDEVGGTAVVIFARGPGEEEWRRLADVDNTGEAPLILPDDWKGNVRVRVEGLSGAQEGELKVK